MKSARPELQNNFPAGRSARQVEPEWLDELPPDDPRARHSRRDLQRLNALMRHAVHLARALIEARPAHDGIAGTLPLAELGAGDGLFFLQLARRLARARPAWRGKIFLVDRQPVVRAETVNALAALGWDAAVVQADVFDWLCGEPGQFHIMLANLFLHHFDDPALASLLVEIAPRCASFVACEPRRSTFAHFAARSVGAIGANAVTRHDAVASVRAGFRGGEVSRCWPPGLAHSWTLREQRVGWFSHRFLALRNSTRTSADGNGATAGPHGSSCDRSPS